MAFLRPAHEGHDINETEAQRSKFTIVFFGDSSVGKTSLIQRFLGYGFTDEYQPTIEDFYIKHVFHQKKTCELQLIDTSGSYEFPAMRKVDILKADAFVMVYSSNNSATFKRLNRYRGEILAERKEKCPCVVVCNKSDLGHQTTPYIDHRGVQITTRNLVETHWRYHWMECSAKQNIQVEEIFERILQEICKETENRQRKLSSLLQVRKRSTGKPPGLGNSAESLR